METCNDGACFARGDEVNCEHSPEGRDECEVMAEWLIANGLKIEGHDHAEIRAKYEHFKGLKARNEVLLDYDRD